jgi:hypothetical protein
MIPWKSRNIEEATLLNPAFCATLLASSVIGWQQQDSAFFPFSYSFLVLPVVLHSPTRQILPRSSRTSLANWIQENPEVKVGFIARAKSLRPFTKEAILFGVSHGLLNIENIGNLHTNLSEAAVNKWSGKLGGEPGLCISKALFIGRWLGSSTTIETTLALWGVSV